MRFIFSRLQNSLNSILLKQLPLSVRMLRGVPLSDQYLVKKIKTVRESVFLQICAVGHLLNRSTATKINTSPQVFDFIGPAKSNWISWFGSDKCSSLFFSPWTVIVLRGFYLRLCSWGNFLLSPVFLGGYRATRKLPLIDPS